MALQIRLRASVPARLQGTNGDTVSQSGQVFTVKPKYEDLAALASLSTSDRDNFYFRYYDTLTGSYGRIAIDKLFAALEASEDATIEAIAGLTAAADQAIYFTGADAAALYTLTSQGRAIGGLGSTAGLVTITGAGAATVRTLTGTANEVTVTNGSGASANPTISLPSALTFTGKTVTGGTFAALEGLGIRSSGSGAYDLQIVNSEDLTASRALTVKLNDAARTLNLAGNLTTAGGYALTLTLAGATNVTLPTSGTLLTDSNTATLTNKTYDTAGTGNSFSINGLAATANTGTGAVVRASSPTITTPVISGHATIEGVTPTGATGTGNIVFDGSPTLITPTIGVATATSINKVAITAPASSATLTIANGKTLTASNTLTLTGTDSSSVAFGGGGTVAYVANKLSVFAATTSAELAGVISDETGSGALVFANTPTLITPSLGVATATSINGLTLTSSTGTLTVANGKTLTASNSLTFTGTDGNSFAFPSGSDTVVTLTASQTLTNKTLTSPVLTSPSMTTPTTGANSGTNGSLKFFGSTSGDVTVKAAAAAGTATVFQLPATNGTTGYTLQTDGNGVTSWVAGAAAASIAVGGTTIGSGTTTRVLYDNAGTLGEYVITGTGNVVMSASPTLTGTITAAAMNMSGALAITSASATALAVGRQGTTNPALLVDASTGTSVTGLQVKSAAAAGGAALSVISSGTNEALTIDAKGSGTITLGGTSTGAITLTRATTMSAALTYGGVTLTNNVTGTGKMVLDASPTITGHATIEGVTATGATGTGKLVFDTSPTLSNPVVGTQSPGDNTTKAASTAFVTAAISASGGGTVSNIATGTGLTGGPITSTGTLAVSLSTASNALGSDVSVNDTSTFFTGPSMAQGTSGTWAVKGTVSIKAGSANTFSVKLWDGTTVIAHTLVSVAAGFYDSITLQGHLASPAANIRMSVKSTGGATDGKITFNDAGSSKDSVIFGERIA